MWCLCSFYSVIYRAFYALVILSLVDILLIFLRFVILLLWACECNYAFPHLRILVIHRVLYLTLVVCCFLGILLHTRFLLLLSIAVCLSPLIFVSGVRFHFHFHSRLAVVGGVSLTFMFSDFLKCLMHLFSMFRYSFITVPLLFSTHRGSRFESVSSVIYFLLEYPTASLCM